MCVLQSSVRTITATNVRRVTGAPSRSDGAAVSGRRRVGGPAESYSAGGGAAASPSNLLSQLGADFARVDGAVGEEDDFVVFVKDEE